MKGRLFLSVLCIHGNTHVFNRNEIRKTVEVGGKVSLPFEHFWTNYKESKTRLSQSGPSLLGVSLWLAMQIPNGKLSEES